MKTKHKFIKNGPAIIDFASKSYYLPFIDRRITLKVKTVAKANIDNGDSYNEEVGKKLAAVRAEFKLAKKYGKLLFTLREEFLSKIDPMIHKALTETASAQDDLDNYSNSL